MSDGPTTIVIFGVSGDLAKRKLLPAICWLMAAGKLPEHTRVVGVARREVTSDSLVESMRSFLDPDLEEKAIKALRDRLQVVRMDSKDPDEYPKLQKVLDEIESGAGTTRILHLSIPPLVALPIIEAMDKVGFINVDGVTTRLLLEKPFGDDLDSARELDARLGKVAEPEQIYRIDHYLGKPIWRKAQRQRFEAGLAGQWNKEGVEKLELFFTETIDIEGRNDFYEQTGALRDLVQSHMLEVLSLMTMEEPEDTVAAHHKARATVLSAATLNDSIRGQYEGYRDEVDNPDSVVETFAALNLTIDTPRWQNVPIYLVAGKALATKRSELRVQFKGGAKLVVKDQSPETGLDREPDGYERVYADACTGDQTYFLGSEEVEATWRLVTPLLKTWHSGNDGLQLYKKGSDGPELWDGVNP